MFDRKQIDEYLSSDGVYCPFCSSTNIDADRSVSRELGAIYVDMRCGDCDARWTEEYRLHFIYPLG